MTEFRAVGQSTIWLRGFIPHYLFLSFSVLMKPCSDSQARDGMQQDIAGEFDIRLERLRADMQAYQERVKPAEGRTSTETKQGNAERMQEATALRVSFMLSSLEAKKREIGTILGLPDSSIQISPALIEVSHTAPSEDTTEVETLKREQTRLTDELENVKERLTALERKSMPFGLESETDNRCKRASSPHLALL